MKLSPEEKKVIDRMAAGVLCRDGFLGRDGRSLAEIIDTDDAAVRRLGVTHEQIARRLDGIVREVAAHMGAPVTIAEGLSACYHEAMGRIPCPWSGCGLFAKGEVELSEAETGRTLRFTSLSCHLIGEHGFYQGRGSRYRLEPAEIVNLLDIKAREV